MSDAIVYDMSQMNGDQSASIFVRRDNLELQDMMNGSYLGNQIIYDTSTLSNSNKYIDYRNARLSIPLCYSVSTDATEDDFNNYNPEALWSGNIGKQSLASTMSMKQTFMHLIHSIQCEWAGTSILQATPYSSFWQTFQLTTTLSMSDIMINGKTIGFYPNGSNFIQTVDGGSGPFGNGTCNNVSIMESATFHNQCGNSGSVMRSMLQNAFIGAMETGNTMTKNTKCEDYESMSAASFASLRQSHLSYTETGSSGSYAVFAVQANIRLRDLCDFFSNLPLLKGVFFRLTLNLNQCQTLVEADSADTKAESEVLNQQVLYDGAVVGNNVPYVGIKCTKASVVSPLGGAVPFMVANMQQGIVPGATKATNYDADSDDYDVLPTTGAGFSVFISGTKYNFGMNVGNKVVLTQTPNQANNFQTGLGQSTFMYVNAYTFNPIFEEAYLSRPAKTITYEDIFQFTTSTATEGQPFQFLITNGLSNLKSVLIMPFFDYNASGEDCPPPYQSPFDSAPDTPSPMVQLTNFNVTVAGANMIYNSLQYPFQMWENHLSGINSINGNLTNGLSSGLLDFWKFQRNGNFYYVDCSRMLPVDQSLPKSIQISGINQSTRPVQFFVFASYGVEISVDILTGARI